MRSALAEEVRREQRERWARLTPAELLRLTDELTEAAIGELMSARRIDRAGALRVIARSRRFGRRPSRCGDAAG